MNDIAHDATPDTMTAVVQDGYGPIREVLTVQTVARPEPGPGQVLVRVAAAGVNTPDWAMAIGEPLMLRPAMAGIRPSGRIPGSDMSGTVEAVGEGVTDLAPGDAVVGYVDAKTQPKGIGTFAQFAVADATQIVPKPASVSFELAAASVMSGLTALIALRDRGHVGAETRLLINGASGGIGTLAVQMAKAWGAHVTGVCSTANVDLVRGLGADAVIDYTKDQVVDLDERYDVILDNVLNHPPRSMIRLLSSDGIYLPNSIGQGSRWFRGLPRLARAAIMGLGRANVALTTLHVDRTNLGELMAMLDDGTIEVITDRVVPLDDAAAAVEHMRSRRARGNIVLVP